jgi:RNA recognition motif-containing protein
MELGSLTEMLGSSSKSSFFSGTPFQAAKPAPPAPIAESKKPTQAELSKDEAKRVVFVGNVGLECKKKHIRRLLESYGEVVKVWRRSIPLDRGKMPVVAAVALKKVRIR